MNTNNILSKDTELYRKAQVLFNAAADYWEESQKRGSCAIVQITNENGASIFFTRSEYRHQIMEMINRESFIPVKPEMFFE